MQEMVCLAESTPLFIPCPVALIQDTNLLNIYYSYYYSARFLSTPGAYYALSSKTTAWRDTNPFHTDLCKARGAAFMGNAATDTFLLQSHQQQGRSPHFAPNPSFFHEGSLEHVA